MLQLFVQGASLDALIRELQDGTVSIGADGGQTIFPDSDLGNIFQSWSGVAFRILLIFNWILLNMRVLVHPSPGLLCGVVQPCLGLPVVVLRPASPLP